MGHDFVRHQKVIPLNVDAHPAKHVRYGICRHNPSATVERRVSGKALENDLIASQETTTKSAAAREIRSEGSSFPYGSASAMRKERVVPYSNPLLYIKERIAKEALRALECNLRGSK